MDYRPDLRTGSGCATHPRRSRNGSSRNTSRARTMRSCWWCVTRAFMNDRLATFGREYAPALRSFLQRQHEAALEQAYELGRVAVARNIGILDVARIHQEILAGVLTLRLKPAAYSRTLKAAEIFLLESLSPFEA